VRVASAPPPQHRAQDLEHLDARGGGETLSNEVILEAADQRRIVGNAREADEGERAGGDLAVPPAHGIGRVALGQIDRGVLGEPLLEQLVDRHLCG